VQTFKFKLTKQSETITVTVINRAVSVTLCEIGSLYGLMFHIAQKSALTTALLYKLALNDLLLLLKTL